jgi:DNA-binding MarR family transcriptional regulator
VTGLASILGITKGAVSQTIGKLEKKKMIDRVKINGKEISLSLTAAGEKAYRAHEGFHANHFRELQRAMKGLTPVQIGFIEKIFKEIDAFYGVFKKRIHQR